MKILVLISETGGGKDFLRNKLIKDYGFNPLVSYTTRPMRHGEVDGVDYHFIDEDEYAKDIDQFVANRYYHVADGSVWYYGLKEPTEDKNYVVILDRKGYEQFKSKLPCVGVYISVFDETERYFRALNRLGDKLLPFDNQELYRRIQDDKKQLEGIHEVVDFTIPQLYTETTYILLQEKLRQIGFIK